MKFMSLGLQRSCRGGKSKTRTPKAPGERLQHMVILYLGSNLLKSTGHEWHQTCQESLLGWGRGTLKLFHLNVKWGTCFAHSADL